MRMEDLLEKAERELKAEDEDLALEIIIERLKEIRKCKKVLQRMEDNLQNLLEKDVEDVIS